MREGLFDFKNISHKKKGTMQIVPFLLFYKCL